MRTATSSRKVHMQGNQVVRLIYTLFVGILLTLFVGVGINTFYVPPTEPKYPAELMTYEKQPTEATEKQTALQRDYDKKQEAYQAKLKPYNRNVSIMTLAAAVILLSVSMVFEKKIKFIADGVMLGGLFTLMYSIGRGLAAGDSKYSFVMITAGLIVVGYMGYRRFAHEHVISA